MHLFSSPGHDGSRWSIGNTICHCPMLTVGFKQQWCSLHGSNKGFPKYVHSIQIYNGNTQRKSLKLFLSNLLVQFWNILTVCLICWDTGTHLKMSVRAVSIYRYYSLDSPLSNVCQEFDCIQCITLLLWEISQKKKCKVSFRKKLVHCKFRRNVAQAGANPPKKITLELGWFLPQSSMF